MKQLIIFARIILFSSCANTKLYPLKNKENGKWGYSIKKEKLLLSHNIQFSKDKVARCI